MPGRHYSTYSTKRGLQVGFTATEFSPIGDCARILGKAELKSYGRQHASMAFSTAPATIEAEFNPREVIHIYLA